MGTHSTILVYTESKDPILVIQCFQDGGPDQAAGLALKAITLADGPCRDSPYRIMKALAEAGVNYEVVTLANALKEQWIYEIQINAEGGIQVITCCDAHSGEIPEGYPA